MALATVAIAGMPPSCIEFDRGRGHDDDRRVAALQALVKHVHRPQVKGGRVVGVGLGRLAEFLRHLPLGIAEDHAGLPFALGLRLHRHRVLERGRDLHVLDLDRNDIDAPGLGARVDDALEVDAQLLPPLEHVGEHRLADHVAQRGLRRPVDRRDIVGDVERRHFRIDHLPEQDRVDIDRHGVAGHRLFRLERRGDDANVDPEGHGVEDRHDEEQARALEAAELAEPQDDDPLPLTGDFDRACDDRSDDEAYHRNRYARAEALWAETRIGQKQAGGENDDEYQPRQRIRVSLRHCEGLLRFSAPAPHAAHLPLALCGAISAQRQTVPQLGAVNFGTAPPRARQRKM